MTQITEKQLIDSLKQLKEIKPRKEWASLLKSEILSTKPETIAKFSNFEFRASNFFFGSKIQKSLVYSFAVILLLIFGAFGIIKLLPVENVPQNSIKQNIVALNSKINDLVQATKEGETNTIPYAKDNIKSTVSALAKNLKDNPNQDSDTLNDIASGLKTLADVTGIDLSANSDVQNLYQTVVQNQIADLQKTTLTADQQKILSQAQDLYNQGNYSAALEKIWDLSNNTASPTGSQDLIDTTTPTN